MPIDQNPLRNFRFRLEIEGVDAVGFQEVSGLTSEYAVVEYREGNEVGSRVRKLTGLRKFSDVTLKRGIVGDKRLWDWHDSISGNPDDRRAVVISLLGADGNPVCRWLLRNAWPSKYEGPSFDAEGNEIALETLTLSHEGLDLEGE